MNIKHIQEHSKYIDGKIDKQNSVDLITGSKLISLGDEVAVLVESTNTATFRAYLSWKELF